MKLRKKRPGKKLQVQPHGFADRLLDWFDRHGRQDLPWQQDRTPYGVWVSEIMLQQTRVTTVIPYYERFMRRFPSVARLAKASLDEVLHLWTGLGYYARARNLRETAGQIMVKYGGELPLTVEELQTLPGIGRSTAGAIVAICTDTRAPILDGNVKRVLARYFAIQGWPGDTTTAKKLWQKAETLTPDSRVADYTQAIMDLGAMICTRSSPDCTHCPFDDSCAARATGRMEKYPGRKPPKALPVKKTCMLLIEADGEVLLEKRPPTGLWGGLYGLPECNQEDALAKIEAMQCKVDSRVQLDPFRHSFTHFHLDITPLHIVAESRTGVADGDRHRWYKLDVPDEIGLTKPARRLLSRLR